MFERLKRLLRFAPRRPMQAAPRETRPRLSVTIGLDFGTSTTKCVINLEGLDKGKDRFLAVAFPSKTDDAFVLCVPTAIGVPEDREVLILGEDADVLPEDRVIRSFKMAVPCIGNNWGDYRSPFMASTPGHFDIYGRDVSASDLCTLYLSVILQQVKRQVAMLLKDRYELNFYLNLAAPLSDLNPLIGSVDNEGGRDAGRDRILEKEYLVIGQRALRLSNCCFQPWPFKDAMDRLEMERSKPILPHSESPAYVVPETHAAIAGFMNRPDTRSGKFMTLDVGAGSTDVSLFWLEKYDSFPKAWYYASGSLHQGMDALDRLLANVTGQFEGRSARARREALQQEENGLKRHRSECAGLLASIDKHRRTTFGSAYRMEKRPDHWGNRKEADIVSLLIGGGARVDLVQDLNLGPLWPNMIGGPAPKVLDLDVTKWVLDPLGGERRLAEIAADGHRPYLLIIAEGLANKIVDIPPFGSIESTEQIGPRKRIPIPPDQWWCKGMDETWGLSLQGGETSDGIR
jgi:hypothetical protein